jgi:hypothetical protein
VEGVSLAGGDDTHTGWAPSEPRPRRLRREGWIARH